MKGIPLGKLINKLLGKQSSADLAVALEKARADLTAAESAVETARTAYDAALLSETPAALRKLHDGITDASIEADRATAVIAKLEKQHAEALESEAADQRQRRYDDAKAASESAEKRLRREYPRAAIQIRELLAEVAAASLAVQAANEDRPQGAPALVGPEHSRSQHHQYQEVISEDTIELWSTIDSATPVRDELQRTVVAHAKGRRGMMRDRSESDENPLLYGTAQTEHGPLEVVRKRFRRTKFLPDRGGYSAGPLSHELVLPPLDAGATPYWTPAYDAHDAARQAVAELKPAPKRAERVPEFSYSLAPRETADV